MNIFTIIAAKALSRPRVELQPGDYFIPEAGKVYYCDMIHERIALYVERDSKIGLFGLMLELDSMKIDFCYLFADGAKERFGDAAGEEVLSSHRGSVFVTDDPIDRWASISPNEVLRCVGNPYAATC